MPAIDRIEVRRLFELVCDLDAGLRADILLAEGASAEVAAEVLGLCACDLGPSDALQAGVERELAALTEADTELGAGDRLGAWRLVRLIGAGGMGNVFLAERADGHFEQQVAIKMIRGFAETVALEHFTRERQILATLHHPSIARLVDGGTTPGGQPYLVLDFVEGMPIDVFCKAESLGFDARVALFLQVCDAVQFAHQRLIIHCDLKPANVLVAENGQPFLLDFGIARALGLEASTLSANGSYLTPGYASPEQLRGEALSAASDVFALGLILFELLCDRPARREGIEDAKTRISDDMNRPSDAAESVAWKPRLAGDIDAIVLHATAAHPAQRYETVTALSEDIRRHLAHRPVLARVPTARYRAGKLLRRRWLLFSIGSLVLALIAFSTWRIVAERDRALAAEIDARREAASAMRTRDFLVSVFKVSNPRLGAGRDVLARDVLDEGANRIGEELDDEPAIKAVLVDTLATAYRYIGIPKRSVELLRQAVPLYLDPRVQDPLAAAAALSQLSVAYINSAYPKADALDAANQALELRQRNAADPLALADSYNSLGVVLTAVGRTDEAKQVLERGLATRRSLSPDEDEVAATLHNLGLAQSAAGDFDAALKSFAEALALREKRGGKQRSAYQATLAGYGTVLGRAGRTQEAIVVLTENLALVEQLFGEDVESAANANNELGSVLHDAGRFRDAADHYRESLRINRLVNGPGSANAAKPLNNLASAHEDMGEYNTAIALFRESLVLRRNTLPAQDPMVARAEYNLARVLIRKGDLAEGRVLLDGVLATYVSTLGEADANTIKARLLEIEASLQTGNEPAAAALVEALQSRKSKLSPQQQVQLVEIEARRAELRGDKKQQLRCLEQAWKLQSEISGNDHPYSIRRAIAYAAALASAGNGDLARKLAAEAAPVARAAFAGDAVLQQELDRLVGISP